MGKLVVTEFVTLDGVAQSPGGRQEDQEAGFEHGGWQVPFDDDGADDAAWANASGMDALLLGRKTYDNFAGFWPTAPAEWPFTQLLNRVPKHVASRTLAEPLAWQGSSLLDGPVAESVAALKEQYDELHVIGSLDLVQSLLTAGLVDRFVLWHYPVVLGPGKRVFDGGTVPTAFTLAHSQAYPSGMLHLVYDVAGTPSYADMPS